MLPLARSGQAAHPTTTSACATRLIQGRFGDFDHLCEAMKGWDLGFRQLDRGPLEAELLQIASDSTLVMQACFGRQFDQRGSTPPGLRSFGFVGVGVSGVRWCGREVSDTTLQVFGAGGEFEAVSPPGFSCNTISFSEEHLARAALNLGLPDIDDLLTRDERVVACNPVAIGLLRDHLRAICEEALARPAQLGSAAFRHQLESELPALVLKALVSSRSDLEPPPESVRGAAARRARSFIDRNTEHPHTVEEVCRAVGVSLRTLQYAFQEHFGTSPKAYLQAVRLEGVRKDLRSPDSQVIIADLANRWGFWHLGQFAPDYSRHFGELPSATRRRAHAGS